ncbi:MAG TPA: tRNA pseudouridine(55) synthase TruB [Burkholderiales bacterium]|nr:tRNA pseudouridine(55) synthase TruB [Burkholderiales bacterium]
MKGRRLDGVLLLDKAVGMASNGALQSAKRLFGAAKAGHAGTLDPLASGLLPILFGEATKLSQLALDADKEYVAQALLGVTTSTGDAEGEVLERRPCEVRADALEPVLARFRGDIDQVPPMHSALKHEGRPLYALAREGREVPRAPRRVRIYELEAGRLEGDRLALRVRCSKGTYIRTLVADLGEALGCGAHLAALRRTAAGGFRVEAAATLEALHALSPEGRDRLLLPLQSLLAGLPKVDLPGDLAERFRRGQILHLSETPEGACSVYADHGLLLGLAEGRAHGELRPRRLINYANS